MKKQEKGNNLNGAYQKQKLGNEKNILPREKIFP